jgi:tetratricopeptide (TPR) repeat protein
MDPGDPKVWLVLMAVARDASDWPRAEGAARSALALDARLAAAWEGLGYALMRQDRNTEAAEALTTAVELRPHAGTQALLDRVRAGLANEKGMTEQQLSHFHVRYDGDAHEAVGREILRALERHYATLVGTLDHQPQATIPVILFTRAAYYNASGAPAWAGGNYDGVDGRVRIPIGGLTAGLTPDMDNTLLHELTHAFVYDRSRGVAPREVHEGLAQYMEGHRITSRLSAEEMQWLADGRIQGVPGLYHGALSYVEYLLALRGMGGMNDLLKAMGDTGNADEAFKQVHGQTFAATQKAWRQRLRQQHGS